MFSLLLIQQAIESKSSNSQHRPSAVSGAGVFHTC